MPIHTTPPLQVWVLCTELQMSHQVEATARELGISRRALRRWYRGEGPVSPAAQLALRTMLGEVSGLKFEHAHAVIRNGLLWLWSSSDVPASTQHRAVIYRTHPLLWSSATQRHRHHQVGAS